MARYAGGGRRGHYLREFLKKQKQLEKMRQRQQKKRQRQGNQH